MRAAERKIGRSENDFRKCAHSAARNVENHSENQSISIFSSVVKTGLFMVIRGHNLILHGLLTAEAGSNLIIRPLDLQPSTSAAVLYRMYRTASIGPGRGGLTIV